ncbi:MAG TPA: glycosyltransferase family 39 protein [Gaiellales bacterium]|nr:glycosyltransferase family 39 protein [Gaiellales bacterium]
MRAAELHRERPAWWALAAAALASFVLHLPFLTTPLSVDEGGYGYVAEWWSRGADLYGDVWVDRPQGLLLLYRGAMALPGSHNVDIRLMAALWSSAIAIVLGLLVTDLAGRRAGAAAALLSGLLSTAPVIEGFTANGELMATLPSLAALALTARWQLRGGLRLMFAAGLFAGAAVLVKQSGYDGGLAAGLWLLLAAWRGWRPPWEALRALGALASGVALIVGVAALHGALTGFHDWWFAVADYRLSVESVATSSVSERVSLFGDSLRTAGPVVGALAALALPGIWLALRRRESSLLAIWLVLSLSGFALGGLFHGHYYVGPLTPLCALAALTLAAVPPRIGLALGVLVLILPIYKAWPAYTADGTRERSLASSSDSRIVKDGAVGRYLHARTDRDDRIYALYADASLYLASGRRAPYPYLWFLGIEHIPGALQRLRDTLAGPAAPRYVAVYQRPSAIDKRGDIGRILTRRYRRVATIEGIPIWRLRVPDRA